MGLCLVHQVTVSQLNSFRNCNHEFTTYTVLREPWSKKRGAAWLSVDPSYYLSLQCMWLVFLGVIYHLLNQNGTWHPWPDLHKSLILGWILPHLSVECWNIFFKFQHKTALLFTPYRIQHKAGNTAILPSKSEFHILHWHYGVIVFYTWWVKIF